MAFVWFGERAAASSTPPPIITNTSTPRPLLPSVHEGKPATWLPFRRHHQPPAEYRAYNIRRAIRDRREVQEAECPTLATGDLTARTWHTNTPSNSWPRCLAQFHSPRILIIIRLTALSRPGNSYPPPQRPSIPCLTAIHALQPPSSVTMPNNVIPVVFIITLVAIALFSWSKGLSYMYPTPAEFSTATSECPVNIPGFEHHGDCNLLCRPAAWTDIVVFYLGNYAAHAATIITTPGESPAHTLTTFLIALLWPGGGVRKGLEAIFSGAIFARTHLERAARSGALCAVVKYPDAGTAYQLTTTKTGHPHTSYGTILRYAETESQRRSILDASPRRRKGGGASFWSTRVHGFCSLPEGYHLVMVPPWARFEDDKDLAPFYRRMWPFTCGSRRPPDPHTTICSSHSLVEILISLIQFTFAMATLFRTRGDQVALYGYAAPGLTILPYAWMSLINLLGHLVRPHYDAMFIVHSPDLEDLRGNFGVRGTVGRLARETREINPMWMHWWVSQGAKREDAIDNLGRLGPVEDNMSMALLSLGVSVISVFFIYIFSYLLAGQTPLHQHVLVQLWLLCGVFFGTQFGSHTFYLGREPIIDASQLQFSPYFTLPAMGFAIFGLAAVWSMLMEFGICIEIPISS